MKLLTNLLDFILHLDKHLSIIIQNFGALTYAILFLIIFAETGFVVTPFLPGDSLLFAAGSLAAQGSLNIWILLIVLAASAILGDTINYGVGKFLGTKMFYKTNNRFLKKEYLDRTRRFYEKYGNKTIVLARFVPIVRTFAPFVAGVGKMNYFKFAFYNILGGILWISIFILGGYFFGNIPIVKRNFTIVIFVIIILSILPMIIEAWKHFKKKQQN